MFTLQWVWSEIGVTYKALALLVRHSSNALVVISKSLSWTSVINANREKHSSVQTFITFLICRYVCGIGFRLTHSAVRWTHSQWNEKNALLPHWLRNERRRVPYSPGCVLVDPCTERRPQLGSSCYKISTEMRRSGKGKKSVPLKEHKLIMLIIWRRNTRRFLRTYHRDAVRA